VGASVQQVATSLQRDPTYYLYERYLGSRRRSRLLDPYYALKPWLPRSVQLALRRAYARRQARRPFPAWPIEPVLVELQHETWRRRLRVAGAERLPFVNFWPHGCRFAWILTHDVEGPAGVENIPRVLEVEQRHGVVSSWNFVAECYSFDRAIFGELGRAGCEVGLHGLHHDGELFRDRASFERQLPRLHHYLADWGAAGFRSPATHRNADWMVDLGCSYDSSFPDTDPFEPLPGGCCSIFPFFLGNLVELPITLAQDHTLWEILGDQTIARWLEKSRWIIRNHGLVNVIVHPDYVIDGDRLDLYERFLEFLGQQEHGWHALPRDVAEWWRHRSGLRVEAGPEGSARIMPDSGAATVAWAYERDGSIGYQT
jgi:peptidoglycan/xylan/chitin deacetylase (PgdA/CDA1 family)